MRSRLLTMLLLCSGCAWQPGEGFAVIEPTVRVAYTPLASRDAGGDYQRLSSDFQLRMDTATMRLARIELLARASGGGGTRFDPTNPPPGYTICHNGHCDRQDGALIPYEQVEEELAGGGAQATPVATLPVGDVNLLPPQTRPVGCEPDCELPKTTVSRGRWTVETLRLTGTVRDGRKPPRLSGESAFRLELPRTGADALPVVLNSAMDLPSDRANPPRVELALQLNLTAALFDAVDWSALKEGTDGVLDFNHPDNAAAHTALLERLAAVSPEVKVTRGDR